MRRTTVTFVSTCLAIVLVASVALAQGSGWSQVVGGAAPTPAGFSDANNTIVQSATVLDGSSDLIVGTFNATTGSEVWRTGNGVSWLRINTDGYGNPDAALNVGTYSMQVFGGNAYAATWSAGWPGTPVTTMRLWRHEGGVTWSKVTDDGFGDSSNAEPNAMVVFEDDLYIGISNHSDGAEVWRFNGASWAQVNGNGFGDVYNVEISSMVVFDGMLYAATRNEVDGLELWRSPNGTIWNQVGASTGFGGPDHFAAYAMTVYNGALYLSTFNTISGGTVYCTADGLLWGQPAEAKDGFGDSNNFGSFAMDVYRGDLYLGTFNWATGTEVWRYRNQTVWSQVNVDGFGNHKNYAVWTWSRIGGMLFAGLRNDDGCEAWTFKSFIFADGFETGDSSAWTVTSLAP